MQCSRSTCRRSTGGQLGTSTDGGQSRQVAAIATSRWLVFPAVVAARHAPLRPARCGHDGRAGTGCLPRPVMTAWCQQGRPIAVTARLASRACVAGAYSNGSRARGGMRKILKSWVFVVEPPWGIGPQTYALREARETVPSMLPAPIAAHPSPNALSARLSRGSRSTIRPTARPTYW
jgi:hypothetical protein